MSDTPVHRKGGGDGGGGSASGSSGSILSKSKHKNKITSKNKLDLKSIGSPSLSGKSIESPTEFSNYNHIPPIPATSTHIQPSNITQEQQQKHQQNQRQQQQQQQQRQEQQQFIDNPLNDLSSGSSPEPPASHPFTRHALNIDSSIFDSEMISRGSSLYEDHVREHHNSHIMQLTKDISIPTHSTKSSSMHSTTDSSDYYSSDNSIPQNRHISKKTVDNTHNTHNRHNRHNKQDKYKHTPLSLAHHHNSNNKNTLTKSKHGNQNNRIKANNNFTNITNSKASLLSQEEESLLLQALNQSDIRLLKSSIKGNSDRELNYINSYLLDTSFESDNIVSQNLRNLTPNKDQGERIIQEQEQVQPEYKYQHQTPKLESQTPINDPNDNVFVSPKRKRKIPPDENPVEISIIESPKEKSEQQKQQQPSGEPEFNSNIKITPATPKSQKSPIRLSTAAKRISLSPLKSSKNFFKSLSPMRQKNSNKINKKKISSPIKVDHETYPGSDNKQLPPISDTSFEAIGLSKTGIIPITEKGTKQTKQFNNQTLLPGLKSVSSFKTASLDEPIAKRTVNRVPSSSRKVSKNYQEILQRNMSVKSRVSSALTEGTLQTFMSTTTEGGDEFDNRENIPKSLNDDEVKTNETEAYRKRRLEHLKRKKVEKQIRNSHRFSHGVFTESVLENLENDPNIAVNSNRSSRHSRSSDSSRLENLVFNEDSLNSSSFSNSNHSTTSGSKSNDKSKSGGGSTGDSKSNNSDNNNNGNRTQFLIYKDKKSSSSLPAIPLYTKLGKENLIDKRAIPSTVKMNPISIRGRAESNSSHSSNASFTLRMKKRTGTSPCKYRSIIDIYSSSNEDEISIVSSGKSDIKIIENIKDTLINTNYYDSSSSGSPDLDSVSMKFDQSTITDKQQLHNQRLSNLNKRYSIRSADAVATHGDTTTFSGDHSNFLNLLLSDNINNFQINTQSQVSVTGASEFFSAQENLSELSMNQEKITSENELKLKKIRLIKRRNSISSLSNTSSSSSSSSHASSEARSKRRPVSTGSITSNTPIRRPTHNHILQMDSHQLISNDEITQAMKDPISLFSEQNIIRETTNDDDKEVEDHEKLLKDTRKSKRFSKNFTNIIIQDEEDNNNNNSNSNSNNRRLTINAEGESNEIRNKLKNHVYNLQVESSTDAFDSSNQAIITGDDVIINPIYQNEELSDNVEGEENIEQEPITVTKVRSKSPSKLLSLFPYSKDSRFSRYSFRDSFFGGGSNKESNNAGDVTPTTSDSGVNKNDETALFRRSSIFNSISKRNSRNLLQFNPVLDNSEILMSSLSSKGITTDKQQMKNVTIQHSKNFSNNDSERSLHLVNKASLSLSPIVTKNPSGTENDNHGGGSSSGQSNSATTPNLEQTELDLSIIKAQTEANIQTLEKVYFKRYSNNYSGSSQHSINSQTKLLTNNSSDEKTYSSSKEGKSTLGQTNEFSAPQEKNVIDIIGAARSSSSSSSPLIAPVPVATRVSSLTESMDSIQLKDQFILSYQFDKYYKDHMGYKPDLLIFHRQYKEVNDDNGNDTMVADEDGKLVRQNRYCSKNDALLMTVLSILAPPFWIIMSLGILDNKIGKIPSTYKVVSGIFALTVTIGAIIGIAVGLGYGIDSLRG